MATAALKLGPHLLNQRYIMSCRDIFAFSNTSGLFDGAGKLSTCVVFVPLQVEESSLQFHQTEPDDCNVAV